MGAFVERDELGEAVDRPPVLQIPEEDNVEAGDPAQLALHGEDIEHRLGRVLPGPISAVANATFTSVASSA